MNKYKDFYDHHPSMIRHVKRHRWVRGQLVRCNPYVVWMMW